jgi:hypothetical protein
MLDTGGWMLTLLNFPKVTLFNRGGFWMPKGIGSYLVSSIKYPASFSVYTGRFL